MAARDLAVMILIGLVPAACGRGDGGAQEQAAPDTVAVVPEQPVLSDNQALDVLMALSAAGAESADSIPATVSNPEVRRYLNVVRADHQALQAELRIIADSLQLSPESHPAGDRVRAAGRDTRMLVAQEAYGAADAAEIQQQIRLHTLFLGVLDSAVLRGARQQLLAQYANAARPTISAHLQRGEQLERLLREQPVATRPAAASRSPATIDTPPRPRAPALELGRPKPDTTHQRG